MNPQVAISADFLKAYAGIPRNNQKKVRAFIEKFKTDPTQASINYESLESTRDDKVRTVRVGLDHRAVVIHPPQGDVYVLVWVDHHDEAMRWAKNKVFEVNRHTGSFQVWEAVEGDGPADGAAAQAVPAADATDAIPEERLLGGHTDDVLLLLGVPEPLLPAVRSLRVEEDLDGLAPYLPDEATDALYYLAAGYSLDETIDELDRKTGDGKVDVPETVDTNDFVSALLRPESKRQFKVVEDDNELADILNAPLARWRVFLHPSQDKLVRMKSKGPARVLGGAGTGKTVVAMHRARHLAKEVFTEAEQRILFTTFTRNLASDIRRNMKELCGPELKRIEVTNLHKWASGFLTSRGMKVRAAGEHHQQKLWGRVVDQHGDDQRSQSFYSEEWDKVIQAQGVTTEADYLRARRAGRGTRLSRAQRKEVWRVMAAYRAALDTAGVMEYADIVREARLILEQKPGILPYAAVVADEVQDFTPEDLKLLRAMIPEGPNDIFVVGDAHQRIYGHKASLGQCGISVRGRRSRRLTVNYRTTHQIRRFAVALLQGMQVDDLDEGTDTTRGYRSLLQGADPDVRHCDTATAERELIIEVVRAWLKEVEPENICVVARTRELVRERYEPLLKNAKIATTVIKTDEDATGKGVRLATMHRVKGLEFPRMILASVHKGEMPLALPPEAVPDEAAQKNHEESERRLLYVAATRARDYLLITGYGERCQWI